MSRNPSNKNTYPRSDSMRSSSSRRGSHQSSRRPSNLSSLPVEQGIVCSLKESFGFIHCAERPDEIFFHYSEVANCHPDELRIDTEVEFRVGTSAGDPEKLAAFQVNALAPGTVVWETEEEEGRIFQGTVEKAVPRNDGGRGGGNNKTMDVDGSIRVNVPEETEKEVSKAANGTSNNRKNGPLVRLRAGEYTGDKVDGSGNESMSSLNSSSHSSSNNPRLFRGDLVEFRVLTDRRSKQKYARYIKLVQSDKERRAVEKEKKLLENAVSEEGIVVSLNNGFGFIRSNRRREDVYFHYSNVVVPKETSDGGNGANESKEDDGDFQLQKGQEVKFLVVTDTDTQNSNKGSSNGAFGNTKVSARNVEALPAGSVVFHTTVAKGVKGTVAISPHPPSPGVRGDDSKEGKIRLLEPIIVDDVDSKDGVVKEVLLHYSDAPGGVFTYQNHRNQSVSAVWIYDGDLLLFDVIRETIDDSYRAVPTLHAVNADGTIQVPVQNDVEKEQPKPVMRMLAPTLVGRAEGVVHTLKSDYGFIHFAERPIDVHFKMYDILPDELQEDIRKYMGVVGVVKLEPGASVQFDICAHGNITSSTATSRGRGRGGGDSPHERENIRGQRLLLLPNSAVVIDKAIASGIKAVVKSADPKQVYAGSIDLYGEVPKMSLEERHPLISKMLDLFMEESNTLNGRKALVYRDTLSMKDDDVVVEMAKLKGEGLLECTHIPIPGISPHPGRLCIRRLDENQIGQSDAPPPPAGTPQTPDTPSLKKKKGPKELKSMRFDKSSLVDDLREDIPPAPGDVVTCDIFQSRRNGNVLVRNMKIVERNTQDGVSTEIVSTEGHGLGVVKDVVPKRDFGFVSVLDDNAVRRELLFFHLPTDRRGRGLKKGDEVTFDFAMEGGKRIAINIMKVPKGTIPSAASKNACFGYVLMEPSHTSLSDTPARKIQHTMSGDGLKFGNSRWVEGKDETKKANQVDMPEEGRILLLEDKSGMFQRKQIRRGRKQSSASIDSADALDYMSDDGKSVSSVGSMSTDGDMCSDDGSSDNDAAGNKGIVNILSHLGYKNGSIAIHGAGATNSMDGSTNPRRGDLVSFVKGRTRNTVRDIRVEGRQKATLQRGRLENIKRIDTEDSKNKGTARFIAATEKEEVYEIELAEVVSCDAKVLKENESVEGILHDGRIFGICRTCDLYLTSKLGASHKERPKLNLTVKKNRGGTIMAQSGQAKGPDGTNGFKAGWTTRRSLYATGVEKGELNRSEYF